MQKLEPMHAISAANPLGTSNAITSKLKEVCSVYEML